MKAKEYIIQKIVEVGKRHRWLRYPTLALVSLVSLFFLAAEKCMARPRRAIAAMVCIVLIVSQSWYLISLAADEEEPAESEYEDVLAENIDSGYEEPEGFDEGYNDFGEINPEEPFEEVPDGDSDLTDDFYEDGIEPEDGEVEPGLADDTDTSTIDNGDELLPEVPDELIADGASGTDACYISFTSLIPEIKIQNGTISTTYDLIQQKMDAGKKGEEVGPALIDDSAGTNYSAKYDFDCWVTEDGTRLEKDSKDNIYIDTSFFPGDTYSITLYAKWIAKSYDITLSDGLASDHADKKADQVVKAYKNDEGKYVATSFSDYAAFFSRTGYTYTNWEIFQNGSYTGSYIPTATTEYEVEHDTTLVAQWVANRYTIQFKSQKDGEEGRAAGGIMIPIDAQYDASYTLPECEFKKEGYYFTGWINEVTGATYTDRQSVSNLTAEPGGNVTLTAQWEYYPAYLEKEVVEAQYGDLLSDSIRIINPEIPDGQYAVSVTSIVKDPEGDSVSMTLGTFTTETGITIKTTDDSMNPTDQIRFVTDNNIGTIGTYKLALAITDIINNKTINKTVTINLNKRVIQISSISNAEKIYDGTTDHAIGEIVIANRVGDDEVRLMSNGVGVFDTENVGTGKTVTVSDIYLIGADSYKYEAPTSFVFTEGVIKKSQVTIRTYAGESPILTGEKPTYGVEIISGNFPSDAARASAEQAKLVSVLTELCYSDYYTDGNYEPGAYPININQEELANSTDLTIRNYEIYVTPGILKVDQEAPVLTQNYNVVGERLSEDSIWYYKSSPYVEAIGDYDAVYVMTDLTTQAKKYQASSFKDRFTVTQDMSNSSLYIQLANKTTGAVTSAKELNVKVDTTQPTIMRDSISVTTVNQSAFSKVGNFLSFGNFFKEELEVSVPIKDDTNGSGEKAVIYYLIPDGTDMADILAGGGVSAPTGSNGVATFRIAKTFKGKILFVAQDVAGNTSDKAELIDVEGATTNFWVVEDAIPTISIEATDMLGNHTSSENGNYYSKVKVTATVTDAISGVNHILWKVTKDGVAIVPDGEGEIEAVNDDTTLLLSYNFVKTFSESGDYTISAIAYDNATNQSMETDVLNFVVDGVKPTVTVSPEDYNEQWAVSKTIQFSLSDDKSGINYFYIKATTEDSDDVFYPYELVDEATSTYSLTVTRKGTYTIIAVDYAGNKTEVPLVITRVSDEIPPDPVVSFDPAYPEENNEGYWFNVNPVITITEDEKTPDGTYITTYYHLWKDGEEEPYISTEVMGTISLPEEGIYNLRVWAVSASGQTNVGEVLYKIYYDETAPVFAKPTLSGTGNSTKISYKITESLSGLAKVEAVYTRSDSADTVTQIIPFTDEGNGVYSTNINAMQYGSYTLRATDQAGNQQMADVIEPMQILVTGITGNATSGITVTGTILPGTFEYDSAEVLYGLEAYGTPSKSADDLVLVKQSDGSVSFTARFKNLTNNTRYVFAVNAMSTAGEISRYSGSFKTGFGGTSGITLSGVVTDLGMSLEDDSKITLSLLESGAVLQTIQAYNRGTFSFYNVPDGTYTVEAVNDTRSDYVTVIVSNRTIIEPTSLIELYLRVGEKTNVIYEDETTPKLAVSGIENLFSDSTNFGSEADFNVINSGGSVEFCMKVKEISASEVPETDMYLLQNAMYTSENVATYLDLSLYKRVYNMYGLVSESPVSAVNGGKSIRIVVPLSSDLASKGNLSVLRAHEDAVDRLSDVDTNQNTYTFQSALYSTYALVYSDSNLAPASTSTRSTASTSNTRSTASTSSTSYTRSTASTSNTSNTSSPLNTSSPSNTSYTIIPLPQGNTTVYVPVDNGGGNVVIEPVNRNTVSSPKTGDAANVGLVIGIMLLSLASGLLIIKKEFIKN